MNDFEQTLDKFKVMGEDLASVETYDDIVVGKAITLKH